jgi:hypothetical protein
LFPEIFVRPVVLKFDQRRGSSDVGAVLLQAAERRYGSIAAVAFFFAILGRRARLTIGCGNFSHRIDLTEFVKTPLAADPMHKVLLDGDPATGLEMASQPTLSRVEHAVGPRQARSLPMMGFVTLNDEAEQYLCAAVLRPGNVTASAGAVGILRRLMALIRCSFARTSIRVVWTEALQISNGWRFWMLIPASNT